MKIASIASITAVLALTVPAAATAAEAKDPHAQHMTAGAKAPPTESADTVTALGGAGKSRGVSTTTTPVSTRARKKRRSISEVGAS